ncbi:cyclin [Glarea lozoyensis ATCC 20868]|uniref:Cyclin n=1 Tax=Glarea lozoyensis (strain ATCC 20868 / MF5171) TaxID=1116229 RepID=S3CN36_GLAL2|nr:cyclin [Glarea lozoyensis ATCC 20868]EPE26614.1 cyclin [Glarea lozoyensis ATCC 20868]
MHRSEDDSPPYVNLYRAGPYSSSIASSASSSSASVWSDAASQTSDDSSVTSASEQEIPDVCCPPSFAAASSACEQGPSVATYWPKKRVPAEVAPEQRQHPRRTSGASQTRCPPPLVRQSDRKVNFVDSLVDSSAQIVEAIWPLSSVVCRSDMGNKGVLPLRTFIQETLRRSRTSYSTLQVALYYLILIKPHVPKHDFTMEQPDDAHSIRALQCGRRMFLSALILASKYLQDRNYSARAWSKISGLNTLEINQNEMAFLLAVNWELHITDAVFQRWTDIVLKYTPNQPPSPGSSCARIAEQSATWKDIILRLNTQLDNIEEMRTPTSAKANVTSISVASPRSLTPMTVDCNTFGYGSNDSTPTPKYYTPNVLEPSPSSLYPPTKVAPALGLLPTPRLTPQSSGFNTPAVSAANYMLSGKSSMCLAMSQASNVCNSQLSERWQTSSPQSYVSCRRSSLANSVSSMSSPESMVSDTSSRSSRSSSISSASSLMAAPTSSKSLDVQARCRYAKLCSERQNRTFIATVPEYCDNGPTSSPESYTAPVGKDFLDLSLDTPLARRELDLDVYSKDEEAARALQDLHNHPRSSDSPTRGSKRSRPQSMDNTLQENVREMLTRPTEDNWSDEFIRARAMQASAGLQVPIQSTNTRKRVCCASEAKRSYPQSNTIHPAFGGIGGPGMWSGILN